MKRAICLAALSLLPCLAITSVCSTPSRADGGPGQSVETRIRIDLTGPAITRITPIGQAEFRGTATQRQLTVQVQQVMFADGTVLSVKVNGAAVGTLTLKQGGGKLELNTKDGATVPSIKKGDVLTVVSAAGAVVESGTF